MRANTIFSRANSTLEGTSSETGWCSNWNQGNIQMAGMDEGGHCPLGQWTSIISKIENSSSMRNDWFVRGGGGGVGRNGKGEEGNWARTFCRQKASTARAVVFLCRKRVNRHALEFSRLARVGAHLRGRGYRIASCTWIGVSLFQRCSILTNWEADSVDKIDEIVVEIKKVERNAFYPIENRLLVFKNRWDF